MIKVVKAREAFTTRYQTRPEALPYDAHLAVAELTAFHAKASVMIPKVIDPHARALIRETLMNLLELTKDEKPIVMIALSV